MSVVISVMHGGVGVGCQRNLNQLIYNKSNINPLQVYCPKVNIGEVAILFLLTFPQLFKYLQCGQTPAKFLFQYFKLIHTFTRLESFDFVVRKRYS